MDIILDAMGGDNAPRAIVEGSVQALQEFSDISITLVGRTKEIKQSLQGLSYDQSRLTIVPASEVITMDDLPVQAIKQKKDASMVVALNMVKKDPEAMMISAGNTGALVAGGTLIVRRMKGVRRPPLAVVLPTASGQVLLIDGGANTDCRPQYLNQFGIMGSIYMNKVFEIDTPKVGLINNGEEEEKGNELTKEAYQLLKKSPINFVGNAEGRDLLSGDFDVLVCDGFTGNIVLKFLEGSAMTVLGMLKEYILESSKAKFGYLFMKDAFRKLQKKMDYAEYGGSLLLGLNGGVMKAHGSSDEKAIFSAIRAARKFMKERVLFEIKSELEAL